eukprot:m.49122 g.49122  ORF g.49122 m.49122 type:complete len:358 (+) comp7076_c0_seq2:67-1140(+)
MPLEVDKSHPLGEGVFATVYRGRDTDRNVDLAVKVYNDDFGYEEQIHQCRSEFAFLKRLNHDNIIKVLGVGDEGPGRPVSLLMTFAKSGDLHGLLRDVGGVGVAPSICVTVIHGLFDGLVYIHTKHKLMHGDIKPENILMDGDIPLLCDFDAALPFGTVMMQPRGTMAYHPPEYPDPTQAGNADEGSSGTSTPAVAGGAADVWAAAMVVLMLFTGLDPENVAPPGGNLYWRWPGSANDKRRNPWSSFGPTMRKLIEETLCRPDPSHRATTEEFFAQVGLDSPLADELAAFRRVWSRGAGKRRRPGSRGMLYEDGDDENALLRGSSTSPVKAPGGGGGGVGGMFKSFFRIVKSSCTVM